MNWRVQVTAPAGLQAAIDALVAAVPQGRSFVRPSGTEDVVRVYAEAATAVSAVFFCCLCVLLLIRHRQQEACNDLAYRVSCVVYDMAGGVGDKPAPF